jgi:tetratricopeptide (TPR) repeat protein
MKKFIYGIAFIALSSCFISAQETTVWLNGSKSDAEIIKKKTQIESKGLKVLINDFAGREKRQSLKEVASGDEKFDRIFREGRELMDKEEWAKAAAKFNEIACDCPDNKQVDAALYWLAYCYKKQKMYKETNATIERLIKNFPDSDWADDARVLSLQIYPTTRPTGARTVSSGQGVSSSSPLIYEQNKLLAEARLLSEYNKTQAEFNALTSYGVGQQTTLDREDEIKLAAFQSLLANDSKKAIETLGNLFGSGSKASENLKLQILRTLRGNRFSYRTANVDGVFTTEPSSTTIVNEINPLLRDALMKAYQNESSVKVRTEILYSIANINDETSVNYLGQLYSSESNKDLKKSIINSFAVVPYNTAFSGFTTLEAVGVAKAVAGQNTVTPAPRAAQTTNNTLSKNTDTNPVRELRFSKLMDIFRSEKDVELKRLAFSTMQRFKGWSGKAGMVDMLSQLYDAETDDNFKMSIINSFSNLSGNSQATNKLLDIAKNDKSDKMRLEAVRALRNNNSPEVIKFLQSLIN